MKDYLLFIDTETSGLPKNWTLPYTSEGNWPNAVQVSWIIYTREGKKIRERNYYVSNNDFEISDAAQRIHGLTKQFLQTNGIPRAKLLNILSGDLLEYRPLIVGHFIELDYHVIGADYWREALVNPMEELPVFCIMKASEHLQQNPQNKFLRLGDLYELLFKKPLLNQHDAMTDAAATADCFLELVKRNEIKSLDQPKIVLQEERKLSGNTAWIIALILLLFSVLLIALFYG